MSELTPIIKGKADTEAVIYSDGFKTYGSLVNYGYKKLFRVKHGENDFADGHNHINGIENFWGLCKVRFQSSEGVHKYTYYFNIKVCEFRYSYQNQKFNSFYSKNYEKINLLILNQNLE